MMEWLYMLSPGMGHGKNDLMKCVTRKDIIELLPTPNRKLQVYKRWAPYKPGMAQGV